MFEQPADNEDVEVEVERSILWGLWKKKIFFNGKFSAFKEVIKMFTRKK